MKMENHGEPVSEQEKGRAAEREGGMEGERERERTQREGKRHTEGGKGGGGRGLE